MRLLASLCLSGAFLFGSITQIIAENRLWPASFGLLAGLVLAWIGFRKHRRDPDGRTPSATIL